MRRDAIKAPARAATLLAALSILANVFGLASLTGCAHGLGPAPSDAQLENDGSEKARDYLYAKYHLQIRGHDAVRPWAANLSTDTTDDGFESYVAIVPAASDSLATLPVALDRWSHSVALPITLLCAGASVGAGVGMFAGLLALLPDAQTPAQVVGNQGLGSQALLAGQTVGWSTVFGGAAGLLAAAPLTVLTWWALDAIASRAAHADYQHTVEVFNRDLKLRIENGYRPELIRPAPSTP